MSVHMSIRYRSYLQILVMLWLSVVSVQLWAGVKSYIRSYNDLNFTVVEVDDYAKLRLFLHQQGSKTPINHFNKLSAQLKPCEHMSFAMNAGMFHSDFSPVGLYIEKKQKQCPLNRLRGWGNFYLQPNGVLAWNTKQIVILSTSQYARRKFKADYATQSGPMLVFNSQINPIFMAESTSLKLRNAVGLNDNGLYFVISEQPVNFYDLASFMQRALNLEQALYLDGSLSAVYLAEKALNTQSDPLGPMLAYIEDQACP